MIWLVLSILSSTLIITLFKDFEKRGVHTFRAIVFNYWTCVIVGLAVDQPALELPEGVGEWGPYAAILGFLFITLFFLIGRTAQRVGVSVASVSMKLSFVWPVVLAFWYYGEPMTWMKALGAAVAIPAVIFTSLKRRKGDFHAPSWQIAMIPLVIFIGSGIADSLVQYTERTWFFAGGQEFFIVLLFGTAGILGTIALPFLKQDRNWKRDIFAGIALGLPNYGSIYFFFETLNYFKQGSMNLGDSFVFSVNNIGIVLASTLIAWLVFKEKFSKLNLIGLLLSAVVILLFSF